jgi:diketogulonate reductase-like aldo/keto reductase
LAEAYGNLKIVKEALYTAFKPISDGGLEIHRSSLFLTMKVFKISGTNHIASLLERVGVDYFDLLLYHSPTAHFGSQSTMEVNWQKLIIEKQNENVSHIGVSNFYKQHLTRLLKYCNDSDLDDSPLGFVFSKQLLGEANVQQIANETKCDPAQVVLSWLKKLGFYVIPKSSNEDHLRLNFNLHEIDSKYDVMLQSLKKDGFDVFRYMIDLSMDAFSQEISWDNGQVEELKTGTEEEQRKSATTVVVKRTD